MKKKVFKKLVKGDGVLCNNGTKATVLLINIKDSLGRGKMVKLNQDKKVFSCPYFFRRELDCKI